MKEKAKQASNQLTCLKSTAERADAAFGGVRLEPRRVAPSHIAVAASHNLVAGDNELDEPFIRQHLPYHKAALLRNCSAGGGGGGGIIHHRHRHLPSCVHVLHRSSLQLPAAGGGGEVVDYVLSR